MTDTKNRLQNSQMKETKIYSSRRRDKLKPVLVRRTVDDYYDWFGCWVLHLTFLCSPFVFILMCFKIKLWIFAFGYLTWMYYDRATPHNGGRRLEWLRTLRFWRWRRDYFPIKLVKIAELPPNSTYLFASFPHGFLTLGTATNFLTNANRYEEVFPGLDVHVCSLETYFKIPLLRDLLLGLGVSTCSPTNIQKILNERQGNVVLLTVGGMDEMTKSFPGTNNIVVKNRKGFVKIALKAGASLVPVYTFGEPDAYDQPFTGNWYISLRNINLAIGRLRLVFFAGPRKLSHLFGLLPYQKPITTVVGKPIKLPKVENPDKELVDKYHDQFVQQIVQLFDRYKLKYDSQGENAVLKLDMDYR